MLIGPNDEFDFCQHAFYYLSLLYVTALCPNDTEYGALLSVSPCCS
jgi:hypothetical protein